MIKQKELVPKRRFEGFINEWGIINVSEIGNGFYGGGTPRTSIKRYWNGDVPWIQSSDIDDSLFLEDYPKNKITYNAIKNSATRLISRNSIAIVTRVGVGKLSLIPYDFSTSQDFFSISDLNVFPSYGVYVLYNLLQKEKLMVQGTSIKGITKDDLLNKKVLISSSFKEQKKIGQFFKHLDEMITLEQRKINKTKALKSAYLTEMFLAEGERVPKRRFAGFTDDWELCKLEDLIDRGGSGGTPSTSQSEYYNGDILFLGISDITSSNGYIFNTDKKITAKGLENSAAWIVPKESIALAMYASVGKVAILKKDIATSQAFFNMVISDLKTRDFIYQYLVKMEIENSWNLLISTGTQANLNAKKVRELEINIPSSQKEREKIGVFFHKLDRRIALQDDKLDKLKATKKAYLYEMFV